MCQFWVYGHQFHTEWRPCTLLTLHSVQRGAPRGLEALRDRDLPVREARVEVLALGLLLRQQLHLRGSRRQRRWRAGEEEGVRCTTRTKHQHYHAFTCCHCKSEIKHHKQTTCLQSRSPKSRRTSGSLERCAKSLKSETRFLRLFPCASRRWISCCTYLRSARRLAWLCDLLPMLPRCSTTDFC